jgi:hypothetical protein
MPGGEELINQTQIRGITKGFEVGGLNTNVEGGKLKILLPIESSGITSGISLVESYINQKTGGLFTCKPESLEQIINVLKPLTGKREYSDLIMYGPSKEGFVEDRMARLQTIRDSVTELQQKNMEEGWKDMPGLVKSATFVRSSIVDLGLKTTINILEALSKQ